MTDEEIIDCAKTLPIPTDLVPNGYNLGMYPTIGSSIRHTRIYGQYAHSCEIPSAYLADIHAVLRQGHPSETSCIIHDIIPTRHPINIPVYNYSDDPTNLTWNTRAYTHNTCRNFNISAIPDFRINLSDTIEQNMQALQQHLKHHVTRICHHPDITYKKDRVEYATKDPNNPYVTFYTTVKGVLYSADIEIHIGISYGKACHQYKKFILSTDNIADFDALYQKHTTKLLHDIENNIERYSDDPQSQHQRIMILRSMQTQLTAPDKLYRYTHQCLHAMRQHYIYIPHICLLTPNDQPSAI